MITLPSFDLSIAQYVARMQQTFVAHFEQFRRDNETIAERYNDTVGKYFRDRGWYVGPSLGGQSVVDLADAIDEGGHDDAIEAEIAEHVRDNTPEIESEVLKNWPDRAAILRDAFGAHRRGLFTLSIPTFLAQADGIAREIMGAHLFTDHDGVKNGVKIADRAQSLIDANDECRVLMSAFVGILCEKHSMRAKTADRDQQKLAGLPFSPLNRQGVLHGVDLDYPTELNSLRAISLLGLLTSIHQMKNRCS